MAFPKDFKDLLQLFNQNGVEFLIVGGYAFGIYAEPRATKDLDLFIRGSVKNSEAVWNSLLRFRAPLRGRSPEELRDGESIVYFGQPPHRIDLLQKIDGVSFEEAWKDRVPAVIDGDLPVNVISREHLLQNKRTSARPRDLADVKEIEAASKASKNPTSRNKQTRDRTARGNSIPS